MGVRGHIGPRLASSLPRACLERSLSAATRGGADLLFRLHRGGPPLPCAGRDRLGPWIRRLRRRQRSRQGHRHAGADAPLYLLTVLTYLLSPNSKWFRSLNNIQRLRQRQECGRIPWLDRSSQVGPALCRAPVALPTSMKSPRELLSRLQELAAQTVRPSPHSPRPSTLAWGAQCALCG